MKIEPQILPQKLWKPKMKLRMKTENLILENNSKQISEHILN